jgi:ribosomal protein S18
MSLQQDLSPLSVEEEESWVPQFRRGHRERPVPADEVRQELDYKNIDLLLQLVSASGRIKPRRQTRLKPRLQSRVARTIKLARSMALFPYEMRVGDGGEGDTWRRMREFRRVSQ